MQVKKMASNHIIVHVCVVYRLNILSLFHPIDAVLRFSEKTEQFEFFFRFINDCIMMKSRNQCLIIWNLLANSHYFE